MSRLKVREEIVNTTGKKNIYLEIDKVKLWNPKDRKNAYISSEKFMFIDKNLEEYIFSMQVYYTVGEIMKISLFIEDKEFKDLKDIKISLFLLKYNNQIFKELECKIVDKFKLCSEVSDYKSFIVQNNLLKENKLTILCSLEDKILNPKTVCQDDNFYKFRALDRYEKLLKYNQDISDITVTAGEKSFYLHKCILAANSEVFKAMFNNDSREKIENEVKISDVKSEVLQEFFLFIYTGKVNNIDEMADDLMYAAEKYGINDLKNLCEERLSDIINKSNVFKYFKVALDLNAEKLMTSVKDWIFYHVPDLMGTKELEEFNKQYPEVFYEIMKRHFNI